MYKTTKLLLFLLIVVYSLSKELAINYSNDQLTSELSKYFHGVTNQFYVDIGAYDPIYLSKTNHFFSWTGINVEANLKRHKHLMITRINQINLNLAITDKTGGNTKLIWYEQADHEASINSDFIKNNKKVGKVAKEQQVYQMTLTDLCHNYYPKTPKFMSISISGHGYVALNSNDWMNPKCIPEVLVVQILKDADQEQKQSNFLKDNNYVQKITLGSNKIYIHQTKLSYYESQYKIGDKAQENKRRVHWFDIISQISKSIAPNAPRELKRFQHFDITNSPFYIHFASEKIIEIQRLKDYNGFVSSNPDRPILILHYNPLVSKLFLGSNDFTEKEIKIENEKLTLLNIKYDKSNLEVYILNHQIDAPEHLAILEKEMTPKKDKPKCQKYQTVVRQKYVNSDDYSGKQ